MRHPHVLQLIMDALRYWVTEMHVDGFRFDLASALARELHDVDRLSAFFDLIQQDPVVSRVKLIAEPWDVGRGRLPGRQLPAAVERVERPLPRHGARLLARDARLARRPGRAAVRVERPVPGRRPQPARLDQLRHLPRRVHPDRPRVVQRQAQRGERRGQPRRHRRQPVVELRRRGTDRRRRRAGAPGAPTTEPGDHAAAVPGRADDLVGRRARPHPARHEQRLRAGQRDQLDRLVDDRRGPARRSGGRSVRFRQAHPVLRRRRFLEGRPTGPGDRDDIAWFAAERRAHDRRSAWRERAVPCASPATSTATRSPSPDSRGERIVDDSLAGDAQRRARPVDFTFPAGEWPANWSQVLDTAKGQIEPLPQLSRPATGSTCRGPFDPGPRRRPAEPSGARRADQRPPWCVELEVELEALAQHARRRACRRSGPSP